MELYKNGIYFKLLCFKILVFVLACSGKSSKTADVIMSN